MNELPKEATDLLVDAREGHSASPAMLERNLRELHARLPFAEIGSSSGSELEPLGRDTALHSGKHWMAGKLAKVWLSALAVTGAATLTVLSLSPDSTASPRGRAPAAAPVVAAASGEPTSPRNDTGAVEPAPRRHETSAQPTPTHAMPTRSGGAQPVAAQRPAAIAQDTSAAQRAISGPRVAAERKTARSRRNQRSGAAAAPARTAASSRELADREAPAATPAATELDLIEEALTSLRANDAARALSQLAVHRARYPAGRFAVERQGLQVLALCAAGRTREGLQARADFLERASTAPIAVRVRLACTDETNSARTTRADR